MFTQAMAKSCELAKHDKCTCRCGGEFHGMDHTSFMQRLQAQTKDESLKKQKEVNSLLRRLLNGATVGSRS